MSSKFSIDLGSSRDSDSSQAPPEKDAPTYVLVISIGTFVGLLLSAAAMVSIPPLRHWVHAQRLGLLPIGIVWFGAIGGSLASLTGIYFHHKTDWKETYNIWHSLRAWTGAAMGTLGAFFLLVSSEIATLSPTSAKPSINPNIFYAAAFIAGFAEKPFRELVKRLTHALFGSTQKANAGHVTLNLADSGQVAVELELPAAITVRVHLEPPAPQASEGSANGYTHAPTSVSAS